MKPAATFQFGNDAVVIRKYIHGFEGGRHIDLSDWAEDYLRAGHIVLRKTADGTFVPNPVSSGAFSALTTGYEYAGVLTSSVSKETPLAPIMHTGDVNDLAMPYKLTDTVKAALKTAIPTLTFHHD